METTTFSEKRLCSIWARYSDGIAWMDCANVLTASPPCCTPKAASPQQNCSAKPPTSRSVA